MWHTITAWFLAGVSPVIVIGWLVYWWRGVKRRAEIFRTRMEYVSGLPGGCKGVLMEFVRQGHKVALPPYNPFVEILTKDGIISRHSSPGGYDAASYYFTIDLDFLAFLKAHAPKEAPSISDHEQPKNQ
jgi:hypothetical protein